MKLEINILHYKTVGIIIGAKYKQENKLLMQMRQGENKTKPVTNREHQIS